MVFAMSGPNRHFLPQLAMRGFKIDPLKKEEEKTFQYDSKNPGGAEIPLPQVGAGYMYFNNDAEEKGLPGIENSAGAALAGIRKGEGIDPDGGKKHTWPDIFAHFECRTDAFRQRVTLKADNLVNDPAFATAFKANLSPLVNGFLEASIAATDKTGKLKNLPPGKLAELKRKIAKLGAGDPLAKLISSGPISDLVKATAEYMHNFIIERNGSYDGTSSLLREFKFSLLKIPATESELVLGDSIVFFKTEDGKFVPCVSRNTEIAWAALPVTPTLAVIASKGTSPLVSSEELINGAVSCANVFFISPTQSQIFANLLGQIGKANLPEITPEAIMGAMKAISENPPT